MSDKNLLISLRELPSQAGSYLEESVQWVVPAGWNSEVMKLPQGAVVPLRIGLTAIDDGVLVQVSGECNLEGECVRCLDPVTKAWRIDGSDVYFESARKRPRRDEDGEIETEGDELDAVREIVQDQVDIEPLLRDAIFSSAPLQPVCRLDCQGLCGQCGIRLEDAEPGHAHENIDPRLASLADFFANEEPQK